MKIVTKTCRDLVPKIIMYLMINDTKSFTSLDCQFYPDTPFYCIHIKVFSWTFLLIAHRRFTNRAQDAMDAGMKSAQKAATSAVADAAAREVEKQISAGFGQLMGKRK